MMNVLIATNSEYVMPSRVMFHSLLKNAPCPVRLFVFYRELSEAEMDTLRRDAEESGHAEVRFIAVDRKDLTEGPRRLRWISVETYYRLLAQELLPEDVDRVLYLDCDLIVRGSLEEFYHQDLEGNLMAACSSQKADEELPEGEPDTFPRDHRYFNAGVLLYDLKAQREAIDPSVYREIMECFGDRLSMGDQDVLNQVFYRRVKYAPTRYNTMVYDIETQDALNDVLILHYNGYEKPWKYTYKSKWAECFWEYADDFPEYRALKAGILAAQRQYASDEARRQSIGNGAKAEATRIIEETVRYCLAEGAHLIRTGTQNMLLMEPEKRAVFNGLLRLNETGAFLTESLKEPRTVDELAALLASRGRHSLEDARTNARNLLKLLQEYHLLREAEA